MKEIAGDLLPTFDPSDVDEIFQSLENSVSKGWNAEIRARGTEYALKFDWRETARNVMDTYRSLN
jgi:hypothetical protein